MYYLPGTTGWGTAFGGLPTALWTPPNIQTASQTQTAETGSAVDLCVKASSSLPLFYLWYLNDTNLISCSTNCALELTNVQFSQSGAYTVVITNAAGAVTSSPAMLNVIAAVERRPVPGVKLTGQTGSVLNMDCASSLSPAPDWTTLGSVSLTSTSQYYFDLTVPLPPQRFYRTWQTGAPGDLPGPGSPCASILPPRAGTAAEGLQMLGRFDVDVVLLDFDLGVEHGNQLSRLPANPGYAGKILMVIAGMNATQILPSH